MGGIILKKVLTVLIIAVMTMTSYCATDKIKKQINTISDLKGKVIGMLSNGDSEKSINLFICRNIFT